MNRILAASLISGAAFWAAAAAQGVEPQTSDETAAQPDEPPSELDILSRSTQNPFPAFEQSKERRGVSVTLRMLDKITARYTDIEVSISEPVRFGALEILPHYCDKRPPEEFPETTAFLEVFDRDLGRARTKSSMTEQPADGAALPVEEAATPDEAPLSNASAELEAESTAQPDDETAMPDEATEPVKPIDPDRIFSGWMFASTPALNALEHPVYDVWVIDCKTEFVES